MSLNCRDGDGVDDVRHKGPAAQIVHRLVESLEHRAYGNGISGSLHCLVGIVSGVEVWKDEDGCHPPGPLWVHPLSR